MNGVFNKKISSAITIRENGPHIKISWFMNFKIGNLSVKKYHFLFTQNFFNLMLQNNFH